MCTLLRSLGLGIHVCLYPCPFFLGPDLGDIDQDVRYFLKRTLRQKQKGIYIVSNLPRPRYNVTEKESSFVSRLENILKLKINKTTVLILAAIYFLVVATADFYLFKYSLEVELEIKKSSIPSTLELCELLIDATVVVLFPVAALGFCLGLKNRPPSLKWGSIAISFIVIIIFMCQFCTFSKSPEAAYEVYNWGGHFSAGAVSVWILTCAFLCICEKPIWCKIFGGGLALFWFYWFGRIFCESFDWYLRSF